MITTADPASVRALIAAVLRPDERRRVFAIRAAATWTGPEMLDGAPSPVRVVPCPSPLAVRAALADHQAGGAELLALLTPCEARDLGDDVMARLVKGRVLHLDPWLAMQALFRATTLDPQLVDERWIVDELVALAPAAGWPDCQPLNGVLDLDLAWQTWEEARLGLLVEPQGTADVLALADDESVAANLASLPSALRQKVAQRWAVDGGPTGLLIELIATGRAGDVDALGVAAGLLWAPADGLADHQQVARARLEPLLGRDVLDSDSAATWSVAAASRLDAMSSTRAATVLDAAVAVLERAGAAELAVLSDLLPQGFELRLAELGRALLARDLSTSEASLDAIARHRLAVRGSHRLQMAEAAVALLRRRSAEPQPAPTTFAGAAAAYGSDGAWVDEARTLLGDGEQVRELATAYAQLCDEADAARAAENEAFARILAAWSTSEPSPDHRIVLLERLLDDVVVPTAAVAPVLLVVADGLSLAVAHQLVDDVVEEGWAHVGPPVAAPWPVGVALIPTVTDVSRASLLSGQRRRGVLANEKDTFSSHPALRAVSNTDRPPLLFHKRELVGPSGEALPDGIRAAVADPQQRVVGVVVNAVDDHLAKGDQLRVGWDLRSLRPLGWLLAAAADAGRVVVLTADHGHVLDRGRTQQRQLNTGGERWRTAPPPPKDGEIEIAGPRVVAGDGRVVVPYDEHLRYGVPKHGYHGGVTPQEVLVPVAVLARRLPEGWSFQPAARPSWWRGGRAMSGPEVAPSVPPAAAASGTAPPGQPGQVSLFDDDAPSGADWTSELLASPAFAAARQRSRLPRPLPDDRIRRYLLVIDGNGGAIPLAALASAVGEPADLLRPALAIVQRLLNLDGSEVLAVRSDGTVELNRALLALQFEVSSG